MAATSGPSPRKASCSRRRVNTVLKSCLSECEAYWASGEPADKAGAYGIQGLAAQFIRELRGSYSGVMGLPLYETAELLRQAGIELLSRYHPQAEAE